MNDEKSPNETKILSADERRVGEMCRTLKKVEAPTDFHFKLRARLADSQASDFQPRFGFALRYALPALGLILVLGLLAYTNGFLSSTANPLVVHSTETPQSTAPPQNPAVSSLAPAENNPPAVVVAETSPEPAKAPEKNQPTLAANIPKPAKKELRHNSGDNSISSRDLASTGVQTKQPNFNGVIVPKNSPIAENPAPLPVREVLSIMGISADFENGKWKVKSVSANSVGENSGVKANDVIEAIDEQTLSTETVFTKIVDGKTMTITRNGEKSQLRLRAKQ